MSVISVIIPVHNTVDYLRKSVDSVRNQTLRDIEIILVDNLSVDGSSAICDEYALIDTRIKVLHLDRAGLSIARNAGIEVASSPYIGFIDSDDYIAPSMYQKMLSVLLSNNADMAYCNFSYEYEDGRSSSPFQNSGEVFVRSPREVLREIMQDTVSSSACTKLFRRELFDKLRFPEGVFFEDHITTYKWVAMCENVVWVDKVFYYYLQRQTSICHTLDPVKHYHYFLAEFSRFAFIKEQGLFEGEELRESYILLFKECFMHFREIMLSVKPTLFREPIRDMRDKIYSLRFLSKDEIGVKYHKRIRKISYFWPIYYLFHFAFKKKNWKPI